MQNGKSRLTLSTGAIEVVEECFIEHKPAVGGVLNVGNH